MTGKIIGGLEFIFKTIGEDEIFTPGDFTEEHKMIMQTTKEFVEKEIEPNLEEIEKLNYELTKRILRKAGEIGLLGAEMPEKYGGANLDKISSMIIAEQLGRGGSISISYGASSGLAALPIVYFGNEEQRKKYLPKFCSGEVFGAFALTEAEAGSDPMAGKTKAVLSEDGLFYVLNGEKMWITNAGFADIFIVYAKLDGKFSAFIVEKAYGGINPGVEEKKMGIKGSSTAAVCIDNVKVPVENLLWGVGNGLKIALNILNLGRIKIGAGCIGAAKVAIDHSIRYANERKQFGKPISELGAIKEKIARMIVKAYAGESIIYRTAALIDSVIKTSTDVESNAKALSEHAAECAICKVMCSEFLDYVVDEAVQIHGGYGYSADYPIERYYRDSRINRIFEGTNEINRLVIASMLIRKAAKSKDELEKIKATVCEGTKEKKNYDQVYLGEELKSLEGMKNCLIIALGDALNKYPNDLLQQQEIIFRISDIVMEIYTCETILNRAIKEKSDITAKIARVYLHDARYKVCKLLNEIMGNISEGKELDDKIELFNKEINFVKFDIVAALREIATKGIENNCYPF
jgi:alkylation response protein AidB-like acyl-CoA dehydrogenase